MKARQLWFGVVLILVGVLMLMSNLGYLRLDFWGALLQVWPVLLISLGLTMLLSRSRWVFLGPLVLIAAVLYAAINPTGLPFSVSWSRPDMGRYGWQRSTAFSRPWDASIDHGELQVELPAGTIHILGSGEHLISGRMSYQGSMPLWAFEQRANRAIARVSSPRTRSWFTGNRGYRGSIAIGPMVPWDLQVQLGAGTLQGDFRNTLLQRMTVELGAGSLDLTLSDRGLRGEILIEGGASSVKLHIPRGVGVRIHITNPVGTNNFREAGLKRAGDYWISEDYETTSSAYDITVSVGVGKVQLDYVLPYPQV
ncbi:MAG: hypothetical protein GX977_10230 [Firmicutes bacterium]|nr:hypothetical protein [Bacillota bacterium]